MNGEFSRTFLSDKLSIIKIFCTTESSNQLMVPKLTFGKIKHHSIKKEYYLIDNFIKIVK